MITIAPKLTDAGINLSLRNLGGERITFTKFKLGNGDAVENFAQLTELCNPVMELAISEFDSSSIVGAIKLSCILDFAQIEQSFKWTEIGLFCQGEDGKEVLFAYSNDGENAGSLRSDMDGVVGSIALAFIIAMSVSENVQAVVSGLLLYATKEELEEHTKRRDNPHEVTKKQVGLSNVPNVTTNDQTPTYDYAKELGELQSGEVLSTAFGKIAKAIKELILHLKASNPHKLKPSSIGAASSVHSHNTADITKGILPYTRGGTNVDTVEKLRENIVTVGSYIGECDTLGVDRSGMMRIYPNNKKAVPRAVIVWESTGLTHETLGGKSVIFSGMAVGTSDYDTIEELNKVYNQGVWIDKIGGFGVSSRSVGEDSAVCMAENGHKYNYVVFW